MKKIIRVLLFLVILCVCSPVLAAEHNMGDLVPVGEGATVKTDTFTYTEMTYSATVDGKDYGRLNFQSITNLSPSSTYISIDVLLFDAKKENIGFVTYCTDQDYGGEFAQKKLGVGASTSFYINVGSKYFVENKGPSDVMYYSIYDDNKYCHVGGYTKYEGLTIEEIMGGTVMTQTESGSTVSFDTDFMSKLGSIFLGVGFAILIGAIVSLIIQGLILNALHKKMYNESTIVAYLPIGNKYTAVKMAFGEDLAKIYVIAYVIAIPLSFIKFLMFIAVIISLGGFAAFIYDIYKLVTKDYKQNDIFQKKELNTDIVNSDEETMVVDENELENVNIPMDDETIVVDESELENIPIPMDNEEAVAETEVVDESNHEQETILNLDYSNGSLNATVQNMDDRPEAGFDMDGANEADLNTPPVQNVPDGESDLMNLFK